MGKNRPAKVHPYINDTLPPGIIVMGPYRCGTSFLCCALSEMGVNFGPPQELYEADEWNPCGYFQRPDVLQANNDFFVSAGHSAFTPADLITLRTRGNVEHLRHANMDWRRDGGVWGIKDPRFCATLMSWFEAGLLGENAGLIHISRKPLDSARSLLKHPELAAQLCDTSLETALQLILRYDQLAQEQKRYFPGPVLSLAFEEFTSNPNPCISAIDQFIDSLITSASIRCATQREHRFPDFERCAKNCQEKN